ncbi:DUF5676 family membrane protein [Teredinibacter haidensis]|jgi:hypothetical protein|uniref:DUF5676 family membrane protein n=1 Tax=Teredinibacter haidensis TaxID=2731755 RepID=UPI000948FCD8|nr:DUF5676 family membrane protein [Teredinibacter haidensis]PHR96024.1 MAG: hypothetical protein COA68_16405 [Oceanobacter sp.]|tara:strand:+ start:4325 stop:4597 length:273 start_codon:yes stop_codon:yes gene_type:complete
MRINSVKLATVTAVYVAAVWVLCSVAIVVAPNALRTISGAMVHLDLSQWSWDMALDTFVVGLLAWTLFSWVTVWSIVTVYQRLLGGSTYE